MFKAILFSMIALCSFSYPAFAAEPQEDLGFVEASRDCVKVATLNSNRRIDLLYCSVSRFKSCFATNLGGLDCEFTQRFSYNADDYDSYDNCNIVSNLRVGRDPYFDGFDVIEVCDIGRGRRSAKCYVTSKGSVSCD